MEEKVNHPKHYGNIPGIECIDVVRHMDFCTGNAIKYLWRAGLKKEEGLSDSQKTIEDLKKARWYINDKIKSLGGEVTEDTTHGITVIILERYYTFKGEYTRCEPKAFTSEKEALYTYSIEAKNAKKFSREFEKEQYADDGCGCKEYVCFKDSDYDNYNYHLVLTKYEI